MGILINVTRNKLPLTLYKIKNERGYIWTFTDLIKCLKKSLFYDTAEY